MDLKGSLYICHTCLSSDRQLYPLTRFPSLIQLNFLMMSQTTAMVCWECKNTILKFCNFIAKAVTAQRILKNVQNNDDIFCLSTLVISKEQPLYVFEHTDDPLSCQSVKEEEFNSDTENDIYSEHSEQTENKEDVIKDNAESFSTSVENGDLYESPTEKNNLDVKIENNEEEIDITRCKATNNGSHSLETPKEVSKQNIFKADSDEERRTVMKMIKHNYVSEIGLKMLDVPKDVMEKILIVELTDEEMLKQREQKRNHYNFKKLPFRCETCIMGFAMEEKFKEHIKNKHGHIEHNNLKIPENYCCDICKLRFKTIMWALKHRERHYIRYKCRLCMYEGNYLWPIVAHCREKHENAIVGQIRCNICSVVSSTPDEHSEHLKTQHSRTCALCGHKLEGITLRYHMRHSHRQKREFFCDNCLKSFKSKSELETHMAGHDATLAKKLSYCSVCKVQFKKISTYRSHLMYSLNHVKERYRCTDCNKEFVSKFLMRRHYKFYHLKKSEYKCDECNKLFIAEYLLKDHQRKYHGLNRPRNHVCKVCEKKFYNVSMLKLHELIHSEHRGYMCEECGDTFKQPSALYTHTRLKHK